MQRERERERVKGRRWLSLALALALILGLSGCAAAVLGGVLSNSENTPTAQVSTVPDDAQEPASSPTEEPTPEAKSGYGIGERAEADGVAVTLTQVEESTGGDFFTPEEGKVFLLCHFEIENNTDEELSISSILCFDAYVDDFAASMSLSATASSSASQLDGTVAAGKKMAGVIGYEAAQDWCTLEVTFKPSVWGNEELKFIVEKE